MSQISIDTEILENVVKYCEVQSIYDKLGCYGDFYYKIKKLLDNNVVTQPIIVEDNHQTLSNVTKWLDNTDFGNAIMNELATEIVTSICSFYRYGGYEYWDYDTDTMVKYTVDKNNPDTKHLLEHAIETLKDDTQYLKTLGITKGKPTKKMPVSFSEIDWNVFNIFNK